jgi:hypothetical protein
VGVGLLLIHAASGGHPLRRSHLSLATLAIASVVVSLTVTPAYATGEPVSDVTPEAAAWAPPEDASALIVPEDREISEEAWAPSEEDRFSSGESGSQMRAPAGTVAGAPGVGELPCFSFQDLAVSSDSAVRVNISNGNVVVKASDAIGIGLAAGAGVGAFIVGLICGF